MSIFLEVSSELLDYLIADLCFVSRSPLDKCATFAQSTALIRLWKRQRLLKFKHHQPLPHNVGARFVVNNKLNVQSLIYPQCGCGFHRCMLLENSR